MCSCNVSWLVGRAVAARSGLSALPNEPRDTLAMKSGSGERVTPRGATEE